jgi:hypothetical protein
MREDDQGQESTDPLNTPNFTALHESIQELSHDIAVSTTFTAN